MKDISAALTANTFTNWNTSANGSGTPYDDEAAVTMSANTRLYAQWQADTFALNYTLNGASDPGNPGSYTVRVL